MSAQQVAYAFGSDAARASAQLHQFQLSAGDEPVDRCMRYLEQIHDARNFVEERWFPRAYFRPQIVVYWIHVSPH
jgi:hypothetical protein